MKGSVQCSAVQSGAEFCLPQDSNLGPHDPKMGVQTTRTLLFTKDYPLDPQR